ncbi:MAG: WecB/TagA/CpsF family glycosyltransferase [Calditrichia bacterium]|nr:WecB/TagA/CpsF family glycosyltransferase [Calditrichia bacterium]
MIGVVAVFDYLSGRIKISPEWVEKISLRWLYLLFQNPKRL